MNALLIALAIAHGADALSTTTALHRGAIETNPLLPKTVAANVVAQASYTAAEVVLLKRLSTRHPQLARTLGVVGLSVEAGAVGVNVRLALGSVK